VDNVSSKNLDEVTSLFEEASSGFVSLALGSPEARYGFAKFLTVEDANAAMLKLDAYPLRNDLKLRLMFAKREH
jgi:hypothetical protein